VVDKVNADVEEILKSPEAQAFFRDQGADVLIMTPDAFMSVLVEDVKKWARVVKASGARID
jgi:tripartite-type tricarboxylate transporter receptor subunit TctC